MVRHSIVSHVSTTTPFFPVQPVTCFMSFVMGVLTLGNESGYLQRCVRSGLVGAVTAVAVTAEAVAAVAVTAEAVAAVAVTAEAVAAVAVTAVAVTAVAVTAVAVTAVAVTAVAVTVVAVGQTFQK